MVNVTLKPVTRDDVFAVIDLRVTDDQDDFVSPNVVSLAQAAFEPGTYPFVIWHGDIRVGFIQMIDLSENPFRQSDEDPNSVYIWRFMIGREFQGCGYGRAAFSAALDWIKGREVSNVTLTVAPENETAISLYKASGFKPTGRHFDGEDEYHLPLT